MGFKSQWSGKSFDKRPVTLVIESRVIGAEFDFSELNIVNGIVKPKSAKGVRREIVKTLVCDFSECDEVLLKYPDAWQI